MSDTLNRTELFTGTMPVAERQRFDLAALDSHLRAHIDGFTGPLSVEQFTERLTSSGLMDAEAVSSFSFGLPAGQRPADGVCRGERPVGAGEEEGTTGV